MHLSLRIASAIAAAAALVTGGAAATAATAAMAAPKALAHFEWFHNGAHCAPSACIRASDW